MTVQVPPEGDPSYLPDRYAIDWIGVFLDLVAPSWAPGLAVLDVGSGRRPAVPPDVRPANCRYVGLDIAKDELAGAPAGSYDEAIVGDVSIHQPALVARFDLIVSWQVLEHVVDPAVAMANLRSYLRPGGRFVGLLSGRHAPFAIINRILPPAVGRKLLAIATARDEGTVFRAHYRYCSYDGLATLFGDWRHVTIYPEYRGESYFRFMPVLHRAYLRYEDWICQHGVRNLATHYYVSADT